MTSHCTRVTLHDFGGCLETAFRHFLLGCHNVMVMVLARVEVALSWDLGDVTRSFLTLLIAYHIHQGHPFSILHHGVY